MFLAAVIKLQTQEAPASNSLPICKLPLSGIWLGAVLWKHTDVSEEPVAYISVYSSVSRPGFRRTCLGRPQETME